MSHRFCRAEGITVARASQYWESFESSRTSFPSFCGARESLMVQEHSWHDLHATHQAPKQGRSWYVKSATDLLLLRLSNSHSAVQGYLLEYGRCLESVPVYCPHSPQAVCHLRDTLLESRPQPYPYQFTLMPSPLIITSLSFQSSHGSLAPSLHPLHDDPNSFHLDKPPACSPWLQYGSSPCPQRDSSKMQVKSGLPHPKNPVLLQPSGQRHRSQTDRLGSPRSDPAPTHGSYPPRPTTLLPSLLW